MSGYLLLCAINSGRVAQVLDTTTGLKYPVALPKPGGALDRTIARDGWTALKPGYSLQALPDHGVITPIALTTAWTVCASANSSVVIANARHENEQTLKRIQLISVDGVERQVDGPFQNAVGDLLDGTIVTAGALVDWDGTLHDLPSKGAAEGVISGRTILMIDCGRVKLVDATTSDEIAGLNFGVSLYSLKANPSGSALAQSAGSYSMKTPLANCSTSSNQAVLIIGFLATPAVSKGMVLQMAGACCFSSMPTQSWKPPSATAAGYISGYPPTFPSAPPSPTAPSP